MNTPKDTRSTITPVFVAKDKYTSCCRWYLDAFLTGTPWRGRVLDVGGKKQRKRGLFRPPLNSVETWEYVNIDAETMPDYVASAESLPIADKSFDMVLLSEVLEHLQFPEQCLEEAFRVLKDGGDLVVATPFMYPLHADPYDFQRWLPEKYVFVLSKIGFQSVDVVPMGGCFASMHDLVQLASRWAERQYAGPKMKVLSAVAQVCCDILYRLSKKYPGFFTQATTGYYVIARKGRVSGDATG